MFGDLERHKSKCLEEIQKWDRLEDDEVLGGRGEESPK